jgi:23S rRNA (cytosine1962-C5)-methyltransferase
VIPTITLKPREDDRIRAGHLWVFRNELRAEPQGLQTGQIVRVTTADGTSLGTGFYNATSNIAVRMVGGEAETIDETFFEQRLRAANELRRRLLPGATAYRMVFGEADLMSGLIIDRYDDVCVVQMLAAGMDMHRDMIVAAIR